LGKEMSDQPKFAQAYINLASPRLGSTAIFASDEFFAPKDRMLQDDAAVFIADKFDDNGKWMDGWETRRRRGGGHDHCIIQLGLKGILHGVDIDTSHFTGNFPPAASIVGCLCDDQTARELDWREMVPATCLAGDRHHYVAIDDRAPVNCLRLNIYPDGGIARLRVYGEPVCEWQNKDKDAVHELSAIVNGGRIIAYNNAHYGTPWSILSAGRGVNMGDGWETRRRREPGNDWIIIALGAPGIIDSLEIDTAFFKGNFPDKCSLQAALVQTATDQSVVTQAMFWEELLGPQKMQADHQHLYPAADLSALGPVNYIRLNSFPDGGISRFRAFGRLA
jgi:allantoicase